MNRKKILIHFIFIIVLLALIFILTKNNPTVNQDELNYLKQYHMTIDNESTHDFTLIQDDLLENQALMVAELHGVKANYDFKYAFITYMNQELDVSDVLVEVSFSSGYLLNEYVHTGNQELLDLVFSFYKGSAFWTREEYNFYQKIYDLNKKLPLEKQINLYGVDIEHSLESTVSFYNYLNNENYQNADEILNLDTKDSITIFLKKNIISHNTFYKEISNWQFREDRIYENYLFLKDYYNITKFYAQFGAKHCLRQIGEDNFQSFAYLLNHDEKSNVKNKVIVIQTFYKDSKNIEAINMNDKIYYRKNSLNKTYYTAVFDHLRTEKITLFKLNQQNSPFMQNMIWYYDDNKPSNHVTTDYYQYIILIDESEACTPFKKTNNEINNIIGYIKSFFKK